MNVKHPDEFELYVIALELIDSKRNTLKYFVFPVMPSTIDDTIQQVHNIKRTLGGITVLSSNTFVPTDVNLQGSFGRKLRVLVGGTLTDFVSAFKDNSGKLTRSSFKKGTQEFFDNRVKTGYGSCKVLQEIIQDSNTLDDNGGVKTLIFHNLALGNSYIVKPINLKFMMSQETNMIWNYNLVFKTLAPLSALYTAQELKQKRVTLAVNGFAKTRVDNVVNKIKGAIT